MKEPVKKLLSAVVLPLAVTGAVNVFTSCTQPNAPKPPVEDQRTPCPDGCGALLKPGEECPNCTITVVPPPKCSECGGKLIDGECINEDCMEYKGPGQPIDTREQLNAPTNLRLRSQGASFMWSHSPMNVAHSFRVYVDGYPTEFIIPNNGTGFSTALLGLAPGTTVTLNVRALAEDGSEYFRDSELVANGIEFEARSTDIGGPDPTPLLPPTSVAIDGNTLSWTPACGSAVGFAIYVGDEITLRYTIDDPNARTKNLNTLNLNLGLQPGDHSLPIRVRAISADGVAYNSDVSEPANFEFNVPEPTLPNLPTPVLLLPANSMILNLGNLPAGATEFLLNINGRIVSTQGPTLDLRTLRPTLAPGGNYNITAVTMAEQNGNFQNSLVSNNVSIEVPALPYELVAFMREFAPDLYNMNPAQRGAFFDTIPHAGNWVGDLISASIRNAETESFEYRGLLGWSGEMKAFPNGLIGEWGGDLPGIVLGSTPSAALRPHLRNRWLGNSIIPGLPVDFHYNEGAFAQYPSTVGLAMVQEWFVNNGKSFHEKPCGTMLPIIPRRVITNAQNIHTQAVLNMHNQFGDYEVGGDFVHNNNVWSFWTQMPSEFQSPRIINNTSNIQEDGFFGSGTRDRMFGLQFNPSGNFGGLENLPPCETRTEPPVYFQGQPVSQKLRLIGGDLNGLIVGGSVINPTSGELMSEEFAGMNFQRDASGLLIPDGSKEFDLT